MKCRKLLFDFYHEAPEAGSGPWAASLASRFADEEIRKQVDAYLREEVQPHVTKLEQEYAPARELWQDLQSEDSAATYLAVAEQLWGEEAADRIAQAMVAGEEIPVLPAPEAAGEAPAPPQPPARDPEVQAMLEDHQARQMAEHYESELARIKALDSRVSEDIFAPFVIGAEGDFDAALASYQQWHAAAYPAAPPEQQEVPPPGLPSEGAPAAAPPIQPKFDSFDAALDSAMEDMRAARQAPATVGSV